MVENTDQQLDVKYHQSFTGQGHRNYHYPKL